MRLRPSICDEWQREHTAKARVNLAECTIDPLSLREFNKLTGNELQDEFNSFLDLPLSYASLIANQGLEEQIASLYDVDSKNILTTSGTSSANTMVLNALLEEGDEVIVLMPIYQQLISIPASLPGVSVKYYMSSEYEGWRLDLKEIEKLCTPHLKMIVMNFPNNPTGLALSEEERQGLVELASNYDAYLFNDEVYYGLGKMKSIADLYEKAIVTSSLSKSFMFPGTRLGWIVANEEVINKIQVYKDNFIVSAGASDLLLASSVLKYKELVLERSNSILKENIAYFEAWLASQEFFTCIVPDSGPVAFLRYRILDLNSKEATLELLEQYGLLVIPGIAFGDEPYFRINLGVKKEILEEGLHILSTWMKSKK